MAARWTFVVQDKQTRRRLLVHRSHYDGRSNQVILVDGRSQEIWADYT
jgi:hypothetical protein